MRCVLCAVKRFGLDSKWPLVFFVSFVDVVVVVVVAAVAA